MEKISKAAYEIERAIQTSVYTARGTVLNDGEVELLFRQVDKLVDLLLISARRYD
jgi:hypothetical protein